MSRLSDNRRAQVRAVGVVMQEAATVLDATGDEALQQLGWEMKRLTVRIYQLLPQKAAGESDAFNAELKRRIDEAVPVSALTGARAVVRGEAKTYISSDTDAAGTLCQSGASWNDECSHSHL